VTAQHLAEYLETSAARYPDRTAVVDSCGQSLTYSDLNRQADALAGFLCASGVKRGDRVGVVLPKHAQAVVALFGIMKAGAAYVPVDMSAPLERGRAILADCQIRAVIVDAAALDVIPHRDQQEGVAPTVIVSGRSEARPREATTSWEVALDHAGLPSTGWRDGDDIAYIIFTSGSTGAPKGVIITHDNALHFIEWSSSIFRPTEQDRFSNHAPLHFDYSVLDIYLSIKHGAAVYLISEELAKNAKALAHFIATHRLTIWGSTPSALIMLLQFGNLGDHDFSSLRLVTFGAEVFPPKYLRELKKQWPGPVYANLYGPTESTTACTIYWIPPVIPDDRDAPFPIGFPCPHCWTLALDNDGLEVGSGEEGLLYISGPSIFRGYWNRPKETADAFIERDGTRWYNTGDLVRWHPDEGFTYAGRKDRMVKKRGYRIELGEIERALYSHSSIREAAVVSIPEPDAGVKIIAVVCCSDAAALSIVDLKMFCATKLPAYMIPDRLMFQNRLPRTSSDKVDYQALKAQLVGARVG
jgi:amino acid adenylation domain-containing protein